MHKFLYASITGLTAILILLLHSCREEDQIGLNILPPGDTLSVRFTDTLSIECFTIREDSLSASANSGNLAGSINDPVFGFSRAGFFSQLAPLKNNPNFGVEPKADSVILVLAYTGSYGDTTKAVWPQTFNVYQVTQDLYKDTVYYSNAGIAYGTRIGSYSFTPAVKDSVWLNGAYEAPQLRIRLDTAFFRTYILNQSGQTTLSSIAQFQSYFKGIYVTPAPGLHPGNRILYFNLASTLTRLHVYYHNATDTGVYDLQIDAKNSCATINHFEHRYTGTPAGQQLIDSTLGSTRVYIQSMSGLKAKLKLPHLKNILSLGQIAINKAELVMSTETNSAGGYAPVEQLAVTGIDDKGNAVITGDYYESTSYRGGLYNSSTGEYRMTITRYIQQVLTGKANEYGLYVVGQGGSVFANRCVLNGAGPSSAKKIRLEITYSLLN